MKGLIFKSLACLMILVVPLATVSAETAAAMLYSNGNFSLNGVSSPRSLAIMPGDRIDTRDAAVSITRSGTNVVIAPHSALIYRGDSVELASGAASIATSKSLAAQVQKIRIAPAAGSATYRVFRGDDQVLIAAVKGTVVVAGPAATRTVAEGATLAVPDPEPQKPGAIPGGAARGRLEQQGSGRRRARCPDRHRHYRRHRGGQEVRAGAGRHHRGQPGVSLVARLHCWIQEPAVRAPVCVF